MTYRVCQDIPLHRYVLLKFSLTTGEARIVGTYQSTQEIETLQNGTKHAYHILDLLDARIYKHDR